MRVDRDLLATRVAKIREQLRHLTRLDAISLDAFLASTTEACVAGIVTRYVSDEER